MMSNRTKRSSAAHDNVPATKLPAPPGPGFQKGQQAARNLLSETSWDEWADLLSGFRSMVSSELSDRKAKVIESAKHIEEAFEALNS
mgnify:CR=1 FL=1